MRNTFIANMVEKLCKIQKIGRKENCISSTLKYLGNHCKDLNVILYKKKYIYNIYVTNKKKELKIFFFFFFRKKEKINKARHGCKIYFVNEHNLAHNFFNLVPPRKN